MWFDTHAHLDDPQLSADLPLVLERAEQADVRYLLAVGTTLPSSRACVEIAGAHERIGASVGIHPNHAHEALEADWPEIERLAANARVWAIGETGLDRYWDDCPFDIQLKAFRFHIALSVATGKPFIVHMRDCEADVVAELRRAVEHHGAPLRGIMHSFTGCWETAQVALDAGLHISFAGMVTYPKNQAIRDIAARVPADRLLVETDCPYLSPHPHRSRRPNEPELVVYTGQVVAEARGMTSADLGRLTTENARRLFRLDAPLEAS